MCACVLACVCVPIQLPLPAYSQLNSLLKYHRCYHHISVFAFRHIYATIFLHDELERETDAGNEVAAIENLSQNSQVCGAFSELNPSLPLLNFLSHCLAPLCGLLFIHHTWSSLFPMFFIVYIHSLSYLCPSPLSTFPSSPFLSCRQRNCMHALGSSLMIFTMSLAIFTQIHSQDTERLRQQIDSVRDMANEWIQQAAQEFKDTVVQATQLPEEVGPYSVLAYLTGHKICILLTQLHSYATGSAVVDSE